MNREIKIGLGLLGVIIVLFGVLFLLNDYNYNKSLIREKDPNLTQEELKIYDDRLAQADAELAKPDITEERKFDWLMYKGFQFYGLGKYELAIQSHMDADTIMPGNVNTQVAIYNTQMDMKDIRGAQKSIRKAIELKSTDPDIWKKYIVLEKDGFEARSEQVKNLYADAIEKTNNHIDIVTSYAVYLESIGDFATAKGQWQQAIILNPVSSEAYQQEITRLDQKIQAQ